MCLIFYKKFTENSAKAVLAAFPRFPVPGVTFTLKIILGHFKSIDRK